MPAGIDQPRTREQRFEMLARIRDMANWTSQKYGMMPYLADYLTTIGYIESRFNPTAANPEIRKDPQNAARGLFGERPESAFRESNNLTQLRRRPNLLLNPRWAFVTAVDYAARGDQRSREKSGREANWLAIRRWWANPFLVHDYGENKSHSPVVRRRLLAGVEGVNREYGTDVDEDFIWQDVQRGGYPGIQSLMRDFGLTA